MKDWTALNHFSISCLRKRDWYGDHAGAFQRIPRSYLDLSELLLSAIMVVGVFFTDSHTSVLHKISETRLQECVEISYWIIAFLAIIRRADTLIQCKEMEVEGPPQTNVTAERLAAKKTLSEHFCHQHRIISRQRENMGNKKDCQNQKNQALL